MLTEHLERCNQFISLDPIEKSKCITHYDRIRDFVIDEMKKADALFNKIYHQYRLSGSYADQLKVSEPNEYDLLMILKFPRPIVQKVYGKPGYVTINLMHRGWYDIAEYKHVLDSYGYLLQDKVLEWLQRIMKRIFIYPCSLIRIDDYQYRIKHSVNGPANTLDIQYSTSSNEITKFSIDFVGALEFLVKDCWVADADIPKKLFLDKSWNAIPKPRYPTRKPTNSPMYPTSANRYGNTLYGRQWQNHNKNRDWICSYAEIERDLIHGLQFIKPLIRIFKKIRDTHKLSNLKSYYIKQIFIHQRMAKDIKYWERPLGELMLEMLDVIIRYLQERNLRSFWHKKFNLIAHFNQEQIEDLSLKLKHIRHDIETHEPTYIYRVILTETEQQEINLMI